MRKIQRTNQFKRDFKRELKGRHGKVLSTEFVKLLELLQNDLSLPKKYRDHSLVGEWNDCRDCHLKPDLIVIYRKPDKLTLQLIRLGSHAQLGL